MTKISHVRLWVYFVVLLMGALLCPREVDAYVRCAMVVEEYSTRGVDQEYADSIASLGYLISWVDIDTLRTKAFYDTFAVVVITGREAVALSPSGNLDSAAQSKTGIVSLYDETWDEINLAVGKTVASENAGYMLNINKTHWISKVSQDTIDFWKQGAVTSYLVFYSFTFPDTFHDIKPLIIDKDNRTDTATVWMCAADSGATIINTGDGNSVAKGRRVFFGVAALDNPSSTFSNEECQFYTNFLRAVSWAATPRDTLNDVLMKRLCLSGQYEIQDMWSGGSEPEGPYATYNSSDNIGQDFDEKVTFKKIDSLALQRKVLNVYRSLTVNLAQFRFTLAAEMVEYPVDGDSNWACAFTFRHSRRQMWLSNRITGTSPVSSPTFPNVCYYWARIDTTGGVSPGDTINWTTLKGKNTSSDVYSTQQDSVHITRATGTPLTRWYCKMDTSRMSTAIMSHAANNGFLSHVLYSNHDESDGRPPGVEMRFYSAMRNNVSMDRMPVLFVTLSSFSTTTPPPTIVASPTSYSVSVVEGNNYPTQLLSITNSAGGAMDFSPSVVGGTWLSVACMACTAPEFVQVIFNTSLLTVGTYADTINIVATGATNTPLKIIVNLEVTGVPPTTTAGQVSGVLRRR